MSKRTGRKPYSEEEVNKVFWERVEKTDTCWNWTGKLSLGYGKIWYKGHNIRVHRRAYEMLVGEIPEGMVIDHLCRNKKCVRPDHLEVVTMRTNTMRGDGPSAKNERKTHCIRGHEFSGKNLYVRSDGDRTCRACTRLRNAKYRTMKRELHYLDTEIANAKEV